MATQPQTLVIGALNSSLGKSFASTYRKSSLVEMAHWAAIARGNLEGRDGQAEQLDASFYYDLECLLLKVADHAN